MLELIYIANGLAITLKIIKSQVQANFVSEKGCLPRLCWHGQLW